MPCLIVSRVQIFGFALCPPFFGSTESATKISSSASRAPHRNKERGTHNPGSSTAERSVQPPSLSIERDEDFGRWSISIIFKCIKFANPCERARAREGEEEMVGRDERWKRSPRRVRQRIVEDGESRAGQRGCRRCASGGSRSRSVCPRSAEPRGIAPGLVLLADIFIGDHATCNRVRAAIEASQPLAFAQRALSPAASRGSLVVPDGGERGDKRERQRRGHDERALIAGHGVLPICIPEEDRLAPWATAISRHRTLAGCS